MCSWINLPPSQKYPETKPCIAFLSVASINHCTSSKTSIFPPKPEHLKMPVMTNKMDFHESEGHAKNLTLIKRDRRMIKMTRAMTRRPNKIPRTGLEGRIWNMTCRDGLQSGWSWHVAGGGGVWQSAALFGSEWWRLIRGALSVIFTLSDCRGRESRPSAPAPHTHTERHAEKQLGPKSCWTVRQNHGDGLIDLEWHFLSFLFFLVSFYEIFGVTLCDPAEKKLKPTQNL